MHHSTRDIATRIYIICTLCLCLLVFASLFGWRGGHWWSANLHEDVSIPVHDLTHEELKQQLRKNSFEVVFGMFGYSEFFDGHVDTSVYVTVVHENTYGLASKFQSLVITGWMIFACMAAGLVCSVLSLIFLLKQSEILRSYIALLDQQNLPENPEKPIEALVACMVSLVFFSLTLVVWLVVGQSVARDIVVALAQRHHFLTYIPEKSGTVLSPFLPVKELHWNYGYNFFLSASTVVVSCVALTAVWYLWYYHDSLAPEEERELLLPYHDNNKPNYRTHKRSD